MTLGALSSEQHRCPSSPSCRRRQNVARYRRGRVIGAGSHWVQANVGAAIHALTLGILLTGAGLAVAAQGFGPNSRRPKLPSRLRDLKIP
jgi:hypothetical protein